MNVMVYQLFTKIHLSFLCHEHPYYLKNLTDPVVQFPLKYLHLYRIRFAASKKLMLDKVILGALIQNIRDNENLSCVLYFRTIRPILSTL